MFFSRRFSTCLYIPLILPCWIFNQNCRIFVLLMLAATDLKELNNHTFILPIYPSKCDTDYSMYVFIPGFLIRFCSWVLLIVSTWSLCDSRKCVFRRKCACHACCLHWFMVDNGSLCVVIWTVHGANFNLDPFENRKLR